MDCDLPWFARVALCTHGAVVQHPDWNVPGIHSERERERERQPSVCVGTTPEATQGGAVHSDPQNSTSHTHLLTHKYTHSLSLHPSLPLSLYIPFEWLSFVFKPEHSLSVSWLSQALLKLPTSHRQRHLRETEKGGGQKSKRRAPKWDARVLHGVQPTHTCVSCTAQQTHFGLRVDWLAPSWVSKSS